MFNFTDIHKIKIKKYKNQFNFIKLNYIWKGKNLTRVLIFYFPKKKIKILNIIIYIYIILVNRM